MLIIRGVNVFPSQIEELILNSPHLAPHYVLEVSRTGALDQLTVKVEPQPAAAGHAHLRDKAAQDLYGHIKSYIGVSATVTVCEPGTVDRSMGKAKRVVDLRG
jgi:phenylacetate-CoA ligase